MDPQNDPEVRRRRHREDVLRRRQVMVDRLGWSPQRLEVWRQEQLRHLVQAARAAPWHRERLKHVDVDSLSIDTLRALPVMTKAEMMENLDEALTDRRLRRRDLDAHLLRSDADPYFLDNFHVLASGGSSGLRGVYVFDWDGWTDYCAGLGRARPALPDGGVDVVARVSADRGSHASAAVAATLHDADRPAPRFPVTLPLPQIVAGLNDSQPSVLMGYPSILAELAVEAATGRLVIAPRLVVAHSEPVLPELRVALEAAWAVPVHNSYGTSEGASGYSCPSGRGLHLADDLAIVELVDADGNPVPAGIPSAKVYVTTLFNHTQPFIRFELSDQLTRIDGDCGCGSAHTWIEEPSGRSDDMFVYPDGTRIHPLVVRSPLGRAAAITEYQVVQTATGADVLIVGDPSLSTDRVADDLTNALRTAGLTHAAVTVRAVDRLPRLPSGKVRRFVPLR